MKEARGSIASHIENLEWRLSFGPGDDDKAKRKLPTSGNGEEVPRGLARLFGGSLKTSARSMDVAYGLVGAVLGLGFLGWLLDRRFGTAPAWLLAGLLLGVVVGLYTLARVVLWKR